MCIPGQLLQATWVILCGRVEGKEPCKSCTSSKLPSHVIAYHYNRPNDGPLAIVMSMFRYLFFCRTQTCPQHNERRNRKCQVKCKSSGLFSLHKRSKRNIHTDNSIITERKCLSWERKGSVAVLCVWNCLATGVSWFNDHGYVPRFPVALPKFGISLPLH